MNEKHVVSLELAKKLKEAGWNKETEFWWVKRHEGWASQIEYGHPVAMGLEGEFYSAPLATEILEELPGYLGSYKTIEFCLSIEKMPDIDYKEPFYVCYNPLQSQSAIKVFEDTLPNALAKMYIYLKQNNLLKKES